MLWEALQNVIPGFCTIKYDNHHHHHYFYFVIDVVNQLQDLMKQPQDVAKQH